MAKRIVFVLCAVALGVSVFSGCTTTGETKKSAAKGEIKKGATMGGAKAPNFTLRVDCAADKPYTDKAGNVWLADQFFEKGKKWGVVGGMTVDRGDLGIKDTNAPKIYETECYSMSDYDFIVPEGKYTVRLHFAETYDGITDPGQRVFSVTINGKVVLKDLDVFKETGGLNKPLVKEFKGVTVTKELVIGFVSNVENPEINGIEIFAE